MSNIPRAEHQTPPQYSAVLRRVLAGVSAADIATIQTERESAESAEVDAFDPAIAAASAAAATALQNGKIKNKVMKRMFILLPCRLRCLFD
jgi:hypothetical protein